MSETTVKAQVQLAQVQLARDVARRVPERRPLVHNITNFVTMGLVARGLLAAGASPIMAHSGEEAADIARQAGALVLNIGTLQPEWLKSMIEAGQAANEAGVPVVLDPVGAGFTAARNQAAETLLQQVKVTLVRGNAGEIAFLAGLAPLVKGVDSLTASDLTRAREAATAGARRWKTVMAATGAVDVVSDGNRIEEVHAGHPRLADIPGSGCLVSALAGAAAAVEPDPFRAAVAALRWLGEAGEAAARLAAGPGTFEGVLLDQLSSWPGRNRPIEESLPLYVIVDGATPPAVLQAALEGGATCVQFREKKLDGGPALQAAERLQALCRRVGVPFLINDRVDWALVLGADGVHLGQSDMPAEAARRLLGPNSILGVSAHNPAEARAAEAAGADYLGVGPMYPTSSKAVGEPVGPAAIARVHAATDLPLVGIGGIGLGRAAAIIDAGAQGVAVISAVVGGPDPHEAAKALLAEVRAALGPLRTPPLAAMPEWPASRTAFTPNTPKGVVNREG